MPPRHTLKIVEIFPSLQGEGLRQGEPTIFIRLAGCNLRCPFCDTKYAWKGGKDCAAGQVVREAAQIRRDFPARWVCLTGGEPLRQEIGPLVRGLKREGFKVQVETNATLFRALPFDWVTISPKPPSCGYDPRYIREADEIKIVVTRDLKLPAVENLRREFPRRVPLLLQPQSNAAWSVRKARDLIQKTLAAGLENIRLSVQLHKMLGIR